MSPEIAPDALEDDDASAPPSGPELVSPADYEARFARLTAPGVADALRAALTAKHNEKVARRRLGATWMQALQAKDFPAEDEDLIPWLLACSEAVRRRESRHDQKWNAMTANGKTLENLAPRPAHDPLPPVLEKVRDAAEEVAAAKPIDARAYEMMKEHYLRDEPVRAVADKWSIPPKGYYDQTERFSKRVRKALLKPGGLALLVLGLALGYLLHRAPRGPEPSTVPPIAALPPPPAPALPDARTLGAAFKADGLAACAKEKWETCAAKLSDAVQIDPPLADDPAVTKARNDAADALSRNAERKTRPPGAKP